jgi:hypothetical protein
MVMYAILLDVSQAIFLNFPYDINGKKREKTRTQNTTRNLELINPEVQHIRLV